MSTLNSAKEAVLPQVSRPLIAVVLPCYRVRNKICTVVESLLPVADYIIAVDDCCPEKSGAFLQNAIQDPKLKIVFHEVNQGVGGAMVTGFEEALQWGADLVIKMDGDGQMDARYLPKLIRPLLQGRADFSKGNRFYDLHALRQMPGLRRIGNLGLTFLAKAASGYWAVSDPTNGFLALRSEALRAINMHLLEKRYFFEISLLIQLNVVRAVAVDVPIPAKYEDEQSSLSPMKALFTFPLKLWSGLIHRIWWRYFIYDINTVTVFLVVGLLLLLGGFGFGAWRWYLSSVSDADQSAGTVAISMLPIILGFQMLLQAILIDTTQQPIRPISET